MHARISAAITATAVIALVGAATASADPPPAPEPAPAPPLPDLAAHGVEMLLGQTREPAAPGTDPGAVPRLSPWNDSYLLPQHVEPALPGQGSIVGPSPGRPHGDLSQLDYLRRLHAQYQSGGLTGALLGQAPADRRPELMPPVDAPR